MTDMKIVKLENSEAIKCFPSRIYGDVSGLKGEIYGITAEAKGKLPGGEPIGGTFSIDAGDATGMVLDLNKKLMIDLEKNPDPIRNHPTIEDLIQGEEEV